MNKKRWISPRQHARTSAILLTNLNEARKQNQELSEMNSKLEAGIIALKSNQQFEFQFQQFFETDKAL